VALVVAAAVELPVELLPQPATASATNTSPIFRIASR
jgi:hypothetical protein